MKYSNLWDGLPQSLGIVSSDIQRVFSKSLKDYIDIVRREHKSFRPKVINDPVWRMVRIEPWEVIVLDSPVVQRLRYIHQLGLAGLIFPGSNYSRFEHSIGVLHQTQRLIESVNRNTRAYAAQKNLFIETPISQQDETLLRLSALLHDIGHGFLSHISEGIFSRLTTIDGYGSIEGLLSEARAYFKCPKSPPMAEVISALIVLLPEFIELLEISQNPYWHDANTLAFSIAEIIIGGRSGTRPFINEIISGSMDADKLDYMPRDCYMAGLPMPVDVERLLERVQMVPVRAERLSSEYAIEHKLSPNQLVQVLTIDAAGGRAFEELVISRVLLYQKLYYHQKVRALVGMVENALELLMDADPAFKKLSTYIALSDTEFIKCHWPISSKSKKSDKVKAAQSIVEDIFYRRLFVRAFAFGPTLICHPNDQKEAEDAWRKISQYVKEKGSSWFQDFRRLLVEKARYYLEKLGQATLAKELKEYCVVIDLPDVQGIAEKTRFFVRDEQLNIKHYCELFHVERWAEAYENQKIIGYIFCQPQLADVIHIAARDLMREKAGVEFEAWQYIKISPQKINEISEILISRGCCADCITLKGKNNSVEQDLYNHQQKQQLFSQDIYRSAIAELETRFQSYQPYEGDSISKKSIYDWLIQFDYEEIPLAITLLQKIKYWNRSAIADAFLIAFENHLSNQRNHRNHRRCQILRLGGVTTSANQLNYFWPDVQAKLPKFKLDILDSAQQIKREIPLILFDDNIGCGGQSITVLMQWFGIPKDKWLVDEKHVDRLDSDIIDNFKSCPVTYLFATGQSFGKDKLIDFSQDILESDNINGYIVAPEDISCFRMAANIFDNETSLNKAKIAFEKAGHRAVEDKSIVWGEEKTKDRLLGYGNAGRLTVFYYNVPTTTVTALWKRCAYNGKFWNALFSRRERR